MLDVHKITEDRQMRSLTGLDMAAFTALIDPFTEGRQAEADSRFPSNARGSGGRAAGAKGC